MKKIYEAPQLIWDEFVPDTMIANSGYGGGDIANAKKGHAGNNQNCWGCDEAAGRTAGEDACFYILSMGDIYTEYCG